MSESKGVSTVIATLLMLVITISLAGTAYYYISGVFTLKTTKTISILDSICNPGDTSAEYTIIVSNLDPLNTIPTSGSGAVSVMIDNKIVTSGISWNPTTIPAGGTAITTINAGVGAGSPPAPSEGSAHRVVVIGPSNREQATAFCSSFGTTIPPGDTTPPTVSITSPTGGTVSDIIPISATASDNVDVTNVQFFVDSNLIGSDNTAPYSISWPTTSVSDGSHTLTAWATDAANNIGTSSPVTVTVMNGPSFDFSISVSPTSGSVQQGSSTTITTTVTRISGTATSVNFIVPCSGLPTGASCSFSPGSCVPTISTCTSQMMISTSPTTPIGTYPITISGTDGIITRSTPSPYSLTVTSAGPSSVNFRYVRWEITKRKGSSNSIQASEFQLLLNGNPVSWPGGTTATNPGGSNPGTEGPDKAIDGTTSTKWLDFNFNGGSSSQLGNSILRIDTVSGVTFNGYRWATANDAVGRDPISWNIHGSNDGSSWTLLDSRNDEPITDLRLTFTSNYGITVS